MKQCDMCGDEFPEAALTEYGDSSLCNDCAIAEGYVDDYD